LSSEGSSTATAAVVVAKDSDEGVRFKNILRSVYQCGDYEKLQQGVFENYLEVKFKDRYVLIATLFTMTTEHRGRWHRPHYK
jgi:hypothetical protein